MELNDLKSDWQEAGHQNINESFVEKMTEINNHPTLRKLRIKLIAEALFMTALLFAYYDGFDGHTKPFYVNLLLIISIILKISGSFISYFLIKNPVKGTNIKISLTRQINLLKRILTFSVAASISFSITLLLFFSSSIAFTTYKSALLVVLVVFATTMFYFSSKNWKNKITHFENILTQFQ